MFRKLHTFRWSIFLDICILKEVALSNTVEYPFFAIAKISPKIQTTVQSSRLPTVRSLSGWYRNHAIAWNRLRTDFWIWQSNPTKTQSQTEVYLNHLPKGYFRWDARRCAATVTRQHMKNGFLFLRPVLRPQYLRVSLPIVINIVYY